jgi:hypothetical protein
VGRPRLTWNDCIAKDLVDFNICEKSDIRTDAGLAKLKALMQDRKAWRISVKTSGIS